MGQQEGLEWSNMGEEDQIWDRCRGNSRDPYKVNFKDPCKDRAGDWIVGGREGIGHREAAGDTKDRILAIEGGWDRQEELGEGEELELLGKVKMW